MIGNNQVPIVIFGDSISAYGVIRGMKNFKIPMYIISQDGRGFAIKSRYVKKSLVLPSKDDDFIQKVNSFIKENVGNKAVLMVAGDDLYLDALSKNIHNLFNNFLVTFPGWDIVIDVREKKRTYEIARKLGIPIPKTTSFSSKDEYYSFLSNDKNNTISFPLIIKSESSFEILHLFNTKAIIISNFEDLKKYLTICEPFYDKVLIQELIPGGEEHLYCLKTVLNKNSQPISIFIDKKIRSSRQFSSCVLTISDWSDQVVEDGLRLLNKICYFGYASVEFKYDSRDNLFKLMEINGRISMNNSHSLLCDINLPYSLYREAVEGPLDPLKELKRNTSVDCIWWYPVDDINNFFSSVKEGSIRKFFASIIAKKCIIEPFMPTDPYPFIYIIIGAIKSLLGRLLRSK